MEATEVFIGGYFGHVYSVVFPFSEAAMHCGLAGEYHPATVEPNGVYLVNPDGSRGPHFTHGEAGVFIGHERGKRYGYDFAATLAALPLEIESVDAA